MFQAFVLFLAIFFCSRHSFYVSNGKSWKTGKELVITCGNFGVKLLMVAMMLTKTEKVEQFGIMEREDDRQKVVLHVDMGVGEGGYWSDLVWGQRETLRLRKEGKFEFEIR